VKFFIVTIQYGCRLAYTYITTAAPSRLNVVTVSAISCQWINHDNCARIHANVEVC